MNNKKEIIILYSTAGMGHKKAAIALLDAFKCHEPEIEAKIIDVMDYANAIYRFLYLNFYVFMMSRAKWLWAALYYFSNNPVVDRITRGIRQWTDFHGLPGLGKMLLKKNPDMIVATHFILPSIAGILRKNKNFKSKMFAVVTDYGPHSYWLSDHIDGFFVGSDSASLEFVARGIPSQKINATGIPVVSSFCENFDKDHISALHGLDKKKKTIFLMSGGFGVGPIGKMLLSLNLCGPDIQVITVCGHNKKVRDDIQTLKKRLNYPVILFGFTEKVAELMSVSDIMITKAGGISVTEALAARLPMILFASIPGQETWNERFLIKNEAAERAEKIDDIPHIVNRMLLSHDAYESFKAGIDQIRRPGAAQQIVDILLKKI